MDDKTTRRLAEAEQRIASLERQLLTRAERPAVSNFPRDRWLGVTTRIGSDYPTATDANTFGVKLLSAAYTPIAPGPSTVTQRERGTVVIARTWPSRYLAEGTQVVVDRLRGVPDGGEWWIAGEEPAAEQWAGFSGGAGTPLSSSSMTNSYSIPLSGTTWNQEMVANLATAYAGPVGSLEGNRLSLTRAGLYYVTAHANLWCVPKTSSGGGFYNADWSIALELRELNSTYAILRGGDCGMTAGAFEHYFSISLSGFITVGAAPHLLNLGASGQHYITPAQLRIYTWSLFAWRIGSELGT